MVRVPGRSTYSGLVRDAGEVLATQLPADFALLAHDDDADRLAATLTGSAASIALAPSAPSSTVSVASPDDAAHAPDAATGSATDPDPAGAAGLPPGLVAAGAYVEQFERTFSSVVWHQRYRQEVGVRSAWFGQLLGAIHGAHRPPHARLRDVLLLAGRLDASWIATVRDVLGRRRRAKRAPQPTYGLQALLAGNEVSTRQLRVLAAENGRHDIGHIQRSFTEPTLVLLFLDAHYRQRFSFTPGPARVVRGRRVATWEFVELGRPTVIRSGDEDMPAHGSLAVDSATGEILKTQLELRAPDARVLTGAATVRFAAHPRFDVLVPGSRCASATRAPPVSTSPPWRRIPTSGDSKRLDAWCMTRQVSGVWWCAGTCQDSWWSRRRMFTSSRALLAAVLLFFAYFPLDYVVRAWRYFSEVATPEEWQTGLLPGSRWPPWPVSCPPPSPGCCCCAGNQSCSTWPQRQLTAVRDDRIYWRRRRYAFAEWRGWP